MNTAALSSPKYLLSRLFGSMNAQKPTPKGPLPRWVNDRQLREQLTRDTGLSPEELGCGPAWNERLPFFMQQSQW